MTEAVTPDRQDLKVRWEAAFGSPPPAYLSLRFMLRALAYEGQCRASGGLPARTRRALKQVAAGGSLPKDGAPTVGSGTHLVREWNGRTYQVEVIEDGYRMDGQVYPSLSAIAKRITGTSWSGPRFFGLARRAGASQ